MNLPGWEDIFPRESSSAMTLAGFITFMKSFAEEDSGQDLVEYALIVAVVGVGGLAVLNTMGSDVRGIYADLIYQLTSAI